MYGSHPRAHPAPAACRKADRAHPAHSESGSSDLKRHFACMAGEARIIGHNTLPMGQSSLNWSSSTSTSGCLSASMMETTYHPFCTRRGFCDWLQLDQQLQLVLSSGHNKNVKKNNARFVF